MAKFTQVRADTWESIQINAGVLIKAFDPATGSYNKSDIYGATNGGISFNSNASYIDFGSDIDNVPANTKQLKRIQAYSPVLSGTFTVVDTALGKALVAAADIDSLDSTHIIPRNSLSEDDFGDLWLVGDYSTENGTNGGFVAVHVKNALSTGGFSWQTTKDGKGQFAFTFQGHYDLEDIDDMPFEVYIKSGSASTLKITSQPVSVTKTSGSTTSFTVAATTTTGSLTYQWQAKAPTEVGYSNISGATSATLALTSTDVVVDNSGTQYRCKVGNGTDNQMSKSATLTVTAGV